MKEIIFFKVMGLNNYSFNIFCHNIVLRWANKFTVALRNKN